MCEFHFARLCMAYTAYFGALPGSDSLSFANTLITKFMLIGLITGALSVLVH
ncbi:hypothetical protein GYMLUDRAFT_668406 [Collybiopsis luxurians FD-317 M1]|uniref:Uncharacterized protein n=1 Tax=Collybiopsis luxurians FD-317 M1 TaxID=944289 RepID=A0A0D0B7K8_9AGAR|nr:hypothetical protein GYMLUDRAFT_668406 [Collybiopsis luxurians FD-317 M1]